uniref:Peptidase_M1 domain-containing protein n=1 Tax=Panagrellus redivivus TaxID=6233 RepID=A0A7E4V6M1_PANRE
MHFALINKTNPSGYEGNRAIWTVKRAYKTCLRDKNGDKDLRKFIRSVKKDLQNMTSRADIAQVVAQYWTKFNVETVFKLSIQPNYVSYSGPALIGNSLTVPVAAMLRFKYDDKVQFFLELVAEMAHYFQMEYYYWERGVVVEGAHLTEIFLALINLEYTNWQEYCFDANFLAKDDYTLYLAAEITHRAMIHFEQPPNDTHDYATRIYNALVADGSSISRLRVATAFALHNGIPTCNTLQVLDCFDPVYEVRVFKWIKIIVNKVV